jgi:hypothetical protein
VNYVLLFIYALLLKFPFISDPGLPLTGNSDGFFYKLLISTLALDTTRGRSTAAVIALILLFTQALQLSRMLNKNKLMNRHNELAAMSYLLITSFYPSWNLLSSALIVNTLLLLVCGMLLQLHNTHRPKTILFNAGLLLGLSNFFYNFSFVFLILAFIGLITYRAFQLREYLILVIGFLFPFVYLFAYQYLQNRFSFGNYRIYFHLNPPVFANAVWILVFTLLIGILVLAGLLTIQRQSNKMNIQARKSWSIFFFYLLLALAIPFLNEDFGYWILDMIPCAAFISTVFFYYRNKKLTILAQWVLFGFVLYLRYIL